MFGLLVAGERRVKVFVFKETLQMLRSALQKENVYVLCFLSVHQGQPPAAVNAQDDKIST